MTVKTEKWIEPLTKKQAEPECGCFWSITGTLLYVCPDHREPETTDVQR